MAKAKKDGLNLHRLTKHKRFGVRLAPHPYFLPFSSDKIIIDAGKKLRIL